MVEIKTNFTVEEIAKSNFEAKNKFKIISIICIIIGAISIVPLFILSVIKGLTRAIIVNLSRGAL